MTFVRLTRTDSGVPWGFRMKGGIDCGQPLVISYVVPGGLADRYGLHTGARIYSIGGDSVAFMTYEQAQQAVIRCCNDLELELVDHHPYGPGRSSTPTSQPSFTVINGPPAAHATLSTDSKRPCSTSNGYYQASPPCSPKSPCGSVTIIPKPRSHSPINTSIIRETHIPCSSASPVSQQRSSTFRHWQIPKPSDSALEKLRCDMNDTLAEVAHSPLTIYTSPTTQANNWHGTDKRFKRGILRTDCAKQRPVCYNCNQVIHGPYIDTMDHCFCPNHFKCTICCALLNERTFAEHDGKFYCEADFAKFVAPKCAKCCQPIIGQITKALNKSWHPHCFTCFCCKKPLGNKFYVEDGDQVLCEPDWQRLHMTQCGRCHLPISEIDRFIEAFGKQFHAHCFCCAACQVPLEGRPFHARDDKPFCRAHAHAVALYG